MERCKYRAGEEDLAAVALVLDLAKAFERVSLPVVWASSASQGRFCACCADTSNTKASTVRRMCGRVAPDHFGHLAGVQVELFASAYCIAGCAE